MRNSECGVRNDVTRKVIGFLVMMVVVIGGLTSASAAERTWTRSEVLAIADAEARRLGYDIEKSSVAINVHSSDEWCRHELDSWKYWAVSYAPLNGLTKGGDLCIVIDRDTGKIIETRVGE